MAPVDNRWTWRNAIIALFALVPMALLALLLESGTGLALYWWFLGMALLFSLFMRNWAGRNESAREPDERE